MEKALGLIEMKGLAATVVALDTALKSAHVALAGVESAKGGGYHTLKLEGDVGAVTAAIYAAKSNSEVAGRVVAAKVIPRPSQGIAIMIHSQENWKGASKSDPAPKEGASPNPCVAKISPEELPDTVREAAEDDRTVEDDPEGAAESVSMKDSQGTHGICVTMRIDATKSAIEKVVENYKGSNPSMEKACLTTRPGTKTPNKSPKKTPTKGSGQKEGTHNPHFKDDAEGAPSEGG